MVLDIDAVEGEGEEQSVAEANLVYFQALAHSRASLTGLGPLTFVTIFILGLDTGVGLNSLIWEGAEEYRGPFIAHLVFLGLMGVIVLVSLFRKLLYRFQVLFSAVFAVMAAVMVYSICFLGVVLSSFDGVRARGFSPELFALVGVPAAMLLAGAVVVHVWLLRRRLRVGHSEKRTMGNFQAVSRASRVRTFWITFSLIAVLAVPNVLTLGKFLTNTVGVAGLLLFVLATPSLPVECTYLAVLKARDRRYWEKLPRRKRRQRRTSR
jgi:hypothetical protein